MSKPFRTRGQAVPPEQRTFRKRRAVRVVVLSGEQAEGRVLMFNDTDPGLPGSSWWVLPGGGIDGGETALEAVHRELAEESGHVLGADEILIGPVATRVVLHGYSDQVTEQAEEIFYVKVAEEFQVDTAGHTEFERMSVQGHAWRKIHDKSGEVVWPEDLEQLVAVILENKDLPLDLGVVEESTVPVAFGFQKPSQLDGVATTTGASIVASRPDGVTAEAVGEASVGATVGTTVGATGGAGSTGSAVTSGSVGA